MNDSAAHVYQVETIDGLVVAIVVLFLGMFLTGRIEFLRRYYIPPAVTGGLICSALVALAQLWGNVEVSFDLALRDLLLLAFFSTIGLSAKLGTLAAGGRALVLLTLATGVFLVVQDITGIGVARAFGAHPGYGVIAGSVSFAGGHGTAIAWGKVAEEAGLQGAGELGIAFATFGLIAGGLVGGPVAGYLIRKHDLQPVTADPDQEEVEASGDPWSATVKMPDVLVSILLLAICIEVGSLVNRLIFTKGVVLPGFLTSLFVGIVLTNLADVLRIRFNNASIERFGEISLNIFLAMSLMSMKLLVLSAAVGPILVGVAAQMLVITLFAMFIVFRIMGRNYDASVICAGFAGLGLGATPVAIANMSAITSRFGPSAKAFLVVPLVGAFFVDLMNAAVIRYLLGWITRTFG